MLERDEKRRSILPYWVTACGFLFFGILFLVRPSLLADRFAPPPDTDLSGFRDATVRIAISLAASSLLAGLATGMWALRLPRRRPGLFGALFGLLVLGCYLALTNSLGDWIVDDAAITFAYSENLVRGYGLVLHPNHPPEEAYSNTLWMLILALVRFLGVPIPPAAKILCIMIGGLTVLWTLYLGRRAMGDPPIPERCAVFTAVLLGAPYIVWSVSGLEHSLQSFLFVAMVAGASSEKHRGWVTGVCLALLMLLRPETPLVGGVVVLTLAWRQYSGDGIASLGRLWPAVLLPAVAGGGLLAFRLWYFGDPLPNPFYAKASDANFIHLVNVVGGGWNYVLTWVTSSGFLVVAPALILMKLRKAPAALHVAAALVAGQLAFAVYAGGDWMGCWRFIAPIVPLLALLTAYALSQSKVAMRPREGRTLGLAVSALLVLCMARQLVLFETQPTTPQAIVAQIGHEFVSLASRLGIDEPTLAHHDAGGTSYDARIDLIDLGGLGNRAIAKHMDDAEFMASYLFEERKPTFFFGADSIFAAGKTKFHLRPEFKRDYVRLEFVGLSYMRSNLCHIRLEFAHSTDGVSLVIEEGALTKVVVTPPRR